MIHPDYPKTNVLLLNGPRAGKRMQICEMAAKQGYLQVIVTDDDLFAYQDDIKKKIPNTTNDRLIDYHRIGEIGLIGLYMVPGDISVEGLSELTKMASELKG